MAESTIKKIGVAGAGTMGSGIALVALYAGFNVVLQDPFPEAIEKAHRYLEKFLSRKGLEGRMSILQLTEQLEDLADCDIVIEAALEDLALKHEIFRSLDDRCSREAVLATNTSTLSVTAIASVTKYPERVAGMHFFNPAPVMPLVEIVRGANTMHPVIDLLSKFAVDLGKTPVVAEDTPGFIVNRVARPFYGEAFRLLGERISTHPEIDLVLRLGAGFKMGPFELMDLIGIDVNATAMQSMFDQTFGEDRYRPHPLQVRQMNSGNLGRKTGQGFYNYRGEQTGIRQDEPPAATGGKGTILFYDGLWNTDVRTLLTSAGYYPEDFPDDIEKVLAAFVTQSHSDDLNYELEKLDWLLPPEVPVFVQCHDAVLADHLPAGRYNGRFIGFDSLFLAQGRVATLVACDGLQRNVRGLAENMMRTLGRLPVWVEDAPGQILPRVICMLVNEAAFALQDGVADKETIDLAMQLGVNYPKGLFAWGNELGWRRVLSVLDHLMREYGEDRYRACRLLRVWARQEYRSEPGSQEEAGG